ncbi:hypothetical protein MOA67_gp115 [Klebsiella phage KpLz-2_45]|uniref:hypothetical protein n=1 Tax=Klebsiella phage KpLz-2_45 TaxID=2698923 RepID=UPI001F12F5E4|nr:hypothetical protein MOA67_gp115 [Klebsiella phage KpLz-2_45]UKS71981.1 hypothetical protein KpLz245_1150 [Klebsiella phage KpLz-2_45]
MNNEGLQEIAQTSVANILEVGRRIMLDARSEDLRIPDGANIEEDLAAAIGAAIAARRVQEGIV